MVNKEEATVSKSLFCAGSDIFRNISKRSMGLMLVSLKTIAATYT